MIRRTNVGLLLAHRLRRWPNSNPTLGRRLMYPDSSRVSLFPHYGVTSAVTVMQCLLARFSYTFIFYIPANMRRWASVGLLLGQRRRRWANSKPTLAQRLMFAE